MLVLLLPYAPATGGLDAPIGNLPWAVGAGLLGLLALSAFYTALAAGTMGVVAPPMTLVVMGVTSIAVIGLVSW
jgi:hypothetical protein